MHHVNLITAYFVLNSCLQTAPSLMSPLFSSLSDKLHHEGFYKWEKVVWNSFLSPPQHWNGKSLMTQLLHVKYNEMLALKLYEPCPETAYLSEIFTVSVSLQDYFFDSKVLTDGELAPNDRCCRICGKIGHYMKDCPKRRRLSSRHKWKRFSHRGRLN